MKTMILGSVALLFALGCSETKECQDLRAIAKTREAVLHDTKSRAEKSDILGKRALAAEGNAKKLMKALGFDEPESRLKELLDERVQKIPGAKIERGTITTPSKDPTAVPISE